MKLIIAGGRNFNDYARLVVECNNFIISQKAKYVHIISGGAQGADRLGELYAIGELGIPPEVFPAEWGKYGKSAGYRRNVDMAENATHLIAFWDGMSKGTKHMIDIATKKGLIIKVVNYWEE